MFFLHLPYFFLQLRSPHFCLFSIYTGFFVCIMSSESMSWRRFFLTGNLFFVFLWQLVVKGCLEGRLDLKLQPSNPQPVAMTMSHSNSALLCLDNLTSNIIARLPYAVSGWPLAVQTLSLLWGECNFMLFQVGLRPGRYSLSQGVNTTLCYCRLACSHPDALIMHINVISRVFPHHVFCYFSLTIDQQIFTLLKKW